MFENNNIGMNFENPGNPMQQMPEAPKTTAKDKRIKLLVLCIVTFMFVSVLPLFNFQKLDIDIYSNDITSAAFFGLEISELEEGDITEHVDELLEKEVKKEKTREGKAQAKEMKKVMVDAVENVEPKIMALVARVEKFSILILLAVFAALAGFIAMIIGAAKNVRWLFAASNIALFVLFIGTGVVKDKFLGAEVLGLGAGFTLAVIMFIVNTVVVLRKK